MESKFKVGDVVRAKSGGPKMTVVELLDNGDVSTSWFTDDRLLNTKFPPDALVPVEGAQP